MAQLSQNHAMDAAFAAGTNGFGESCPSRYLPVTSL